MWIRSFAPVSTGPTQERAIERVDAIERDSDREIETAVRVWGKEIERGPETSAGPGTDGVRIPQLERIDRRLDAFEEWANRTDRRLKPFFRPRTVESTITGESREVWRLPTIALAEFVDGDLIHVAPCTDGRRTIDVFDRLEALEATGETDADPDDSVLRYDDAATNAAAETDGSISERPPDGDGSVDRQLEPSSSGRR
ncbi:hypothetical protein CHINAEXTREME_08660 [Halobiforma lacisalsi AJ5]|uniref:Uncharacterized protein n=1 Tax=Natronobacterium lacisalsi AJ5 TaxID=358396 RepID=M0LA05_NATLA|nr:hypothetical protein CHINAEXTREME_08660 [Halobiforma lacisalsi AJ5]EMA29294.1 hypothetical protein C445_17234 [Halobiforma lacisalsi AJ5]